MNQVLCLRSTSASAGNPMGMAASVQAGKLGPDVSGPP